MAKFTAKITDPVGLHARPASITVSAASKFDSEIKIEANGKSGNLKSIMNIMALGVKQGDEITITAEGADADAAVVEIEKIMKENNLI
ncbi:HPr family phosphocarrier protein [Mycoplasma todarodis]|uniref:HPr family phosphocarrier protein n=1 Tax=Mycoplasma todarodis TaxID=1937191 RepID=UPI003B2E53FE